MLDLPQLYTKPNAESLLLTLADLSSQPASWEATPRSSGTPTGPLSGSSTPYRRKRKIRSDGIPSYLTKIISSRLAWIEDDEQKECIWETAAQRLSERSGRTAMGAISRSFVIPLSVPPSQEDSTGVATTHGTGLDLPEECFEVTLHEPALTGDTLGLKTWASSFLLAKRLAVLLHTLPQCPPDTFILELGSGTGLVGMAAAAVFGKHVIVTDLPEILPNLDHNARANAHTLAAYGGKCSATVLDWTQPDVFCLDETHDGDAHTFPLILAADPIYSPEHPRLLAGAVDHHLMKTSDARVVVEMPLRDAYAVERREFRESMSASGLVLLDEGEETGYDDWSSNSEDDLLEVRCWWSIWGRC